MPEPPEPPPPPPPPPPQLNTPLPSGFKHFLRHENIKPGTVIRYVGNPFNVLFYLAGD